MGKSYTYHVIGYAPDGKDRDRIYPTMSKLGMAQQREKAKRDGLKIEYWYAQTGTGRRMLKGQDQIRDSEIEIKKIIKCVICDGKGYNSTEDVKIKSHCPVCDGSGVTRKDQYSRWSHWQLKYMVAERSTWNLGVQRI